MNQTKRLMGKLKKLSLHIQTYVAGCVDNDNKKDGYRQQNVRQRQKLISIIDYKCNTSKTAKIIKGDTTYQRIA